MRRGVKSIQQPFHTHAKNQINALRILSEIAEKPFRSVPQNFGFGLLRFTLQLPVSHCTSFLYQKRWCLPGTRSWAHRKPDFFQKFTSDEYRCRPRRAHALLCVANSPHPQREVTLQIFSADLVTHPRRNPLLKGNFYSLDTVHESLLHCMLQTPVLACSLG